MNKGMVLMVNEYFAYTKYTILTFNNKFFLFCFPTFKNVYLNIDQETITEIW